jgi:hypothetical protein
MLSPWNAKEVIIPDSITVISEHAFAFFYYLTDFVVPDHITSIEAGAFLGCVNLKSITIPNTIKTIESLTFNFCISLEEIVLPNSVEIVKGYAFMRAKLRKIELGENLRTLQESVFSKNPNLDTLILKAKTPPVTGNNLFSETDISKIVFLVPKESLELYKQDSMFSELNPQALE